MADGDAPDDFEAWAQTHWRQLVAIARVVAADPHLAEDVLQDCLVDVYRRWDRISTGDANPLAYAARVMGSKAANHRRTSWARRVRLGDDAAFAGLVSGDHAGGVHDRVAVAEALGRLSPAQRQVVAMHYLLDMPVAEIAAELDRPVGSVTSDLTRARQRLRSTLAIGGETARE